MNFWRRCAAAGLLAASLIFSNVAPVYAANILQCVPYARVVSGVNLYGDAWTWWEQASGHYDRGHTPRKGAVLAFQPNGPMQLGHVAVVSRVLSDREVLIRHANWSTPGGIEEDVLAIDVSADGDWSQVRVWYSPGGQMGARVNPTFGFIYPRKARLAPFVDPTGEAKVQRAIYTAPEPRDTPTLRAYADAVRDDGIIAPVRRDANFIVEYADDSRAGSDAGARAPVRRVQTSRLQEQRTLGDIIADVKREARIR